MRHHVFQQHLRPALRVDFRGPIRQRAVSHAAENTRSSPASAERRVDQHADVTFVRQGQQRSRDFPVVDGVVHLDEVERIAPHEVHHLRVLARTRGGDAEVSNALRVLQLLQHGDHLLDAGEVMNLYEIDVIGAQAAE